MKIDRTNWKDFQEESPSLALLPTGSTEQHGPHGPLGTDSIIAEEIASYVAEETGALLLPPIRVGISREHSSFPGTLYLSPETFRNQLTDIILSAGNSGVEQFVVVNGHGGNVSAIQEACKNIYHEHDVLALEWTWFNAISASGMGHAGELETSLIMYLCEELINDPPEKGGKSWGKSFHGTRFDYDTSKFTENGVVGDPTGASKEKGKELFDRSTDKLTKLVRGFTDPEDNFAKEI